MHMTKAPEGLANPETTQYIICHLPIYWGLKCTSAANIQQIIPGSVLWKQPHVQYDF